MTTDISFAPFGLVVHEAGQAAFLECVPPLFPRHLSGKNNDKTNKMKTKNSISKLLPYLLVAGSLAAISLSEKADAGVSVTWTQDGTSVRATYSGTWDITGYGLASTGDPFLDSSVMNNAFYSRGDGNNVQVWFGVGTSRVSGTGSSWLRGTDGVGDDFGFDGAGGKILLPLTYTSGGALSGSWSMPGTIDALFPGGLPTNLTVFQDPVTSSNSVSFTAVPEPSSVAILLGGLVFVGMSRRRNK